MKYQPSLPEHNDNVAPGSPLKDLVVILGGLLAILALAYWLMGLAVDVAVDHISDDTEARLHALMPAPAIAPEGSGQQRQAQLQAMADGMRACAGLRRPASVLLADDPVANAVALPGSQVVVFSGLVGKVRSENGMAFVLAHELAHLAHRDHLRAMGRGIVLFSLSALVTGSDSGMTEVLAPANQFGLATYSRAREEAADAAALRILNCRYGHAGGATEFFDAMRGEDGELAALSHFTASHPSMQARIDALNRAIRGAGMKVGPVRPLPDGLQD